MTKPLETAGQLDSSAMAGLLKQLAEPQQVIEQAAPPLAGYQQRIEGSRRAFGPGPSRSEREVLHATQFTAIHVGRVQLNPRPGGDALAHNQSRGHAAHLRVRPQTQTIDDDSHRDTTASTHGTSTVPNMLRG